MKINFKLYFKYIFFHSHQIFLKHFFKNDKNTFIFISQPDFYFLTLHLKLSSVFYSTQLVDMFAYELPISANISNSFDNQQTKSKPYPTSPSVSNTIVVYNFHSIFWQQRFFLLLLKKSSKNLKKKLNSQNCLISISELFTNSNWLEREVSELHGIFFDGKKDLRNLLLQYGDTSAPMLKSYPSIGTKEIFYDSVSDLLIQNPVNIQF